VPAWAGEDPTMVYPPPLVVVPPPPSNSCGNSSSPCPSGTSCNAIISGSLCKSSVQRAWADCRISHVEGATVEGMNSATFMETSLSDNNNKEDDEEDEEEDDDTAPSDVLAFTLFGGRDGGSLSLFDLGGAIMGDGRNTDNRTMIQNVKINTDNDQNMRFCLGSPLDKCLWLLANGCCFGFLQCWSRGDITCAIMRPFYSIGVPAQQEAQNLITIMMRDEKTSQDIMMARMFSVQS
jgi:hypothetical protein